MFQCPVYDLDVTCKVIVKDILGEIPRHCDEQNVQVKLPCVQVFFSIIIFLSLNLCVFSLSLPLSLFLLCIFLCLFLVVSVEHRCILYSVYCIVYNV